MIILNGYATKLTDRFDEPYRKRTEVKMQVTYTHQIGIYLQFLEQNWHFQQIVHEVKCRNKKQTICRQF